MGHARLSREVACIRRHLTGKTPNIGAGVNVLRSRSNFRFDRFVHVGRKYPDSVFDGFRVIRILTVSYDLDVILGRCKRYLLADNIDRIVRKTGKGKRT